MPHLKFHRSDPAVVQICEVNGKAEMVKELKFKYFGAPFVHLQRLLFHAAHTQTHNTQS